MFVHAIRFFSKFIYWCHHNLNRTFLLREVSHIVADVNSFKLFSYVCKRAYNQIAKSFVITGLSCSHLSYNYKLTQQKGL